MSSHLAGSRLQNRLRRLMAILYNIPVQCLYFYTMLLPIAYAILAFSKIFSEADNSNFSAAIVTAAGPRIGRVRSDHIAVDQL